MHIDDIHTKRAVNLLMHMMEPYLPDTEETRGVMRKYLNYMQNTYTPLMGICPVCGIAMIVLVKVTTPPHNFLENE